MEILVLHSHLTRAANFIITVLRYKSKMVIDTYTKNYITRLHRHHLPKGINKQDPWLSTYNLSDTTVKRCLWGASEWHWFCIINKSRSHSRWWGWYCSICLPLSITHHFLLWCPRQRKDYFNSWELHKFSVFLEMRHNSATIILLQKHAYKDNFTIFFSETCFFSKIIF